MFLLLMLVLLPFGLFTACNSKPSIKGDFKKSEYTISLSNEIGFLNEFDVVGVDAKDVKFVSSNEDILSPKADGVFEGIASGNAYIFARINNKNIAKAKVNVKYKFSSPQNLKMSEGVFTFDPSYIIKDNKQIIAKRHELKYKIDDGEEESVVIENGETSYTFTQKGVYEISLRALGDDAEKIDASNEKTGIFTLGVMMPATDFNYVCSESLNQNTQFTWQCDEDQVLFDIYIDGLRVEKDLTNRAFEYNFNAYAENSLISLKIVSKDVEGKRDDTSIEFMLNVLPTPEIDYIFNNDGYLSWADDENATKYKLSIFDENELSQEIRDFSQGASLVEYLDDMSEGVYKVNVMAIGGIKNGKNSLNSKLSNDIEVGKLAVKKPEVKFEGNTAKIKFQEDEYVTNYRISCEGRDMLYDTTNGDTAEFDLSFLSAGEHYLQFTALPTPDQNSQTKVKEFRFNSKIVSRVVNSQTLDYKIYKLGDFTTIYHNLSLGTSILTFNAIPDANYYKVYVNDQFIKTHTTTSTNLISIELDLENPNESNKYEIKVVAGHEEDDVDIAILSEGQKTIEILPTVKASESQGDNYFSWEALDEHYTCSYEYKIYKTNSSFDKASRQFVGEEDKPTKTSDTRTEELDEGYYEIEITSITEDDGYFLSSNFHDEDGFVTYQFIVKKTIESPEVTFSEEGGLHLDIKVKAHTGKVTVRVDGETIEYPPFSSEKDEVTYYFDQRYVDEKFKTAKTYYIEVESSAGTLYDNTLYTPSQPTTIHVTRIKNPRIEVEDKYDNFDKLNHQILHIIDETKLSKEAIVLLSGSQKSCEEGFDLNLFDQAKYYDLDLFDQAEYGGNFVLNMTLKAKEGEGNEYYISSIPTDYKFRRIATPSLLKYEEGLVTWENTDDLTEKYYFSITLTNSLSSTTSRRFFLENPAETEFEFQNYINEILKSDDESDVQFANAYNMAEGIEIEVVAYKNGYNEDEDQYILCSANANAVMGGSILRLEALKAPVLEFDKAEGIIKWNKENINENLRERCKYDIYVNGSPAPIIENYTSTSISKDELADDYTQGVTIEIRVRHPEQLDSKLSSPIYIKKLISPSKVIVGVNSGNYTLSIPVEDSTLTQSVKLNEEEINDFKTGNTTAYTQLIDKQGEQTIIFVAIEGRNNNYYIDSDPVTINLVNLSNQEFTAEIEGNDLVWSNPCEDWETGNDGILKYRMSVVVNKESVNNSRTYELEYFNEFYDQDLKKSTMTLEKFEQEVFEKCNGGKLSQKVAITVSALISREYQCNVGEGTTIYYGNCKSELSVDKLESVGEVSFEVVNNKNTNLSQIEKMANSSIKITFNDVWTGKYDNIKFKIKFLDLKLPNDEEEYVLNANIEENLESIYRTFEYKDGKFSLTIIPQAIAALGNDYAIKPGNTNFTIQVCREGSIDSDLKEDLYFQKFDVPRSQINDDGLLTVDPIDDAEFYVEIKCGEDVFERNLEENRLDLMQEILLGKSGTYSVKILAFSSKPILPSSIMEKSGDKLKGIEDIYIDEFGIINIQLFQEEDGKDNILFEAYREDGGEPKAFTPTPVQDTTALYQYSLLDMLYTFNTNLSYDTGKQQFYITIRDNSLESIKSDSKLIEFFYSTEKEEDDAALQKINSLDKDYIIYNINNNVPTTGFVIDVTFTKYTEKIVEPPEPEPEPTDPDEPGEGDLDISVQQRSVEIVEELVTIRVFKRADEVRGFWAKSTEDESDKGVFVTEKDNTQKSKYQECFAICIGDILSSIEDEVGGKVKIKVSRVGEKDGKVQFSPTIFDVYHLNAVENAEVTNNSVRMDWENQFGDEIAPNQYLIYLLTDNKIIKRYYSSEKYLDLTKIDILEGTTYTLQIRAISFENTIISSDLGSDELTFKKYHKPMAIEVRDGKLMFKKESFEKSKFIEDINTVFGASSTGGKAYYQLIMEETISYQDPVDFEPGNLASQDIVLQFEKLGSLETYTMRVKAYKLFPDVDITTRGSIKRSYVDILNSYASSLDSKDPEAGTTLSMIRLLTDNSRLGIGNDGDLFDDYGATIPAGEYMLTAYQRGFANNVQSEPSDSRIPVYISPAPTCELKAEDKNGKTNYFAEFRPEQTQRLVNGEYALQDAATVYKMVIRRIEYSSVSFDNLIELDIQKEEDGWHFSSSDIDIENVIETLDNGNFKINMTQLSKEITQPKFSSIRSKLRFNEELQVDVYACGNDTGKVINGKSSKFKITYLELFDSNIQFNNGVISVNSPDATKDFKLLVKYKHEASELTPETLTFGKEGSTTIDLKNAGRYEYILVSLSGSSSKEALVVESQTYLIAGKTTEDGYREGLYKLARPELTTENNRLLIDYNIEFDEDFVKNLEKLKFYMANNVSLDPEYEGEDAQYYYESAYAERGIIENCSYVIGALKGPNEAKFPSELTANQFFAYLGGNSGKFTSVKCDDFEGAEYELKLYDGGEEVSPILTSDIKDIRARMLPSITGYNINQGNVDILYLGDTSQKVYDGVGANKEEGTLIYEIKVLYYLSRQESSVAGTEDVYYSEISPFSTTFPGLEFDTDYEFYRLKITIYGAKHSTKATKDAVESMQGNYFLLKDSIYYDDEFGTQVVMGLTKQTSIFTKTNTPYLDQTRTGAGVRRGEITFMIDRTVYFDTAPEEGDTIEEETQERLSVYADYTTVENKQMTVKLEGTFTFLEDSLEQDKVRVVFVPDMGQLLDNSGGAIILRIYAYGKDTIISSPLRITEVYRLANIDEIYYDIELDKDGYTYINFEKYFDFKVNNNNSCYKIVVNMLDNDNETKTTELTVNSGVKRIAILPEFKKLTMRVVDAQEDTETNAKKLLISDQGELNIDVTSTEGLEFTWDNTYKRFEWKWGDETLPKEYFISMRIKGRLEEAFTTNLYYMPKRMGTIAAQSIKLKMRTIGEQANTIYIYSNDVLYGEEEDIDYSIFADGEGTVDAPYEIRSKDNFKNMAIRNDKDVHFKIMEPLGLDVSEMYVDGHHLFESFYASLDGGKNTISINSDKVFTTKTVSFNVYGYARDDVNFSNYSSLFKRIENGASIKNLSINYSINYTELSDSYLIFAPLAYENNGLIENVTLNEVASINIGGVDGGNGGSSNRVFIGGIVGINYSKMSKCENIANIEYKTPQMLNVNLAFAGIALFNRVAIDTVSNAIEDCTNNGNITLITASTQDIVMHIAGITLLNEGGKIAYCGNNGNFMFKSENGGSLTCVGGGIVITNSIGSLEYLYNNGQIQSVSGIERFGGIAYEVNNNSTIDTLVSTVAGQKLIAGIAPNTNTRGENYYGSDNSSTSGLTVKSLSSIADSLTIPGEGGRSLQIERSNRNYIAKIIY